MKLQNKKTGEIKRVEFLADYQTDDGTEIGFRVADSLDVYSYNSLAELNEEWEDYEEPKEYWYIEADGSIIQNHKPTYINHLLDGLKSIGNYFETEEEAEKAVEKLKAWKRLKDKGFEFCCDIEYGSLCGNGFNIPLNAIMPPEAYTDTKVSKDLDLLFGGEE
jgi:hypothetical protein